MLKYGFLFIGVLYLSACSMIKPPVADKVIVPEPQVVEPPQVEPIVEKISPETLILEKLLAQLNEWKGTRYRMGGFSKAGTDCSGFVMMTFREQFGVELPRSTREQHSVGQDVKRSELITGDLVFFHTGRYDHVGIYLQDGQFLHASTRAGVKISSLADVYWNRRFWKAKRLIMEKITKKD